MITDRFAELRVGDEAELHHTLTEKDVDCFADLTGDTNPLHLNDRFASQTPLKKRVVHGMLSASFISALIGTKLPGEGALWYEQQTRFLAPARIGETIRVWARIKHKSISQRIVVLETVVYGKKGNRLIEGEAKIKMMQTEKKKKAGKKQQKGAVIVTGASKGIGAAISRELANEGHPVVVNYAHSKELAEQVADEILSQGGNAFACRADITDSRAIPTMVNEAIERYGQLSGIVNNACNPLLLKSPEKLVWDDFQMVLDVQIKGAFLLAQAVMPHLLRQKEGVIVNIASIVADNIPPIRFLPYTTAKSALIGLSKSLAAEYGPQGIRVNCVSPGLTQTEFIADLPEKAKMLAKMQAPLRQLADPEDVAGTVVFLFSSKARHITGQNIRVCGGSVMM